MPELDSHRPSPSNPDPVASTFSPWHPCGPNYESYAAGMRRCAHLHLAETICQLAPEDTDTEAAAKQWEGTFGVRRINDCLAFTNGSLRFAPGENGKTEAITSITIAVEGRNNLNNIWNRARDKGLCRDGWIDMLGVKWYIVPAGDGNSRL